MTINGRPTADSRTSSVAAAGPSPHYVEVGLGHWAFDLFLDLTPDQLPPDVGELNLKMSFKYSPAVRSVVLSEDRKRLSCQLSFDAGTWKGEWSILEHSSAYGMVVSQLGDPRIEVERSRDPDDYLWRGVIVTSALIQQHISLRESISVWCDLITTVDEMVRDYLVRMARADSVVLRFRFPPRVRAACEQYLLFFGEFLFDLGISATTEVTEADSDVLFAVKPTDSREALSKIRQALDIYLRLPNNLLSAVPSNDIVMQKLLANVRHLESQIALAEAVIHAQHASIEAQEIVIGHQRSLGGDVMVSSLKSVHHEDRLEILDGLVSVRPYEGKGFEINLPQLVRRLRKLFQK